MLLACVFVVMIGFGITMPVLPFYVERLAIADGATRNAVVTHVGLLTGVYALMQLVFAPLWGRWSDRIGRRPLILIGIGGYVAAQILFGLATSLWLLYAARILGGVLSSATLPVAGAFVSDLTTKEQRARGMALLGTAVSLGFVIGPALGGVLTRTDLHFTARFGHFQIDGFSVPFFAAAAIGLLTLGAAILWLPESMMSSQAGRSEPAAARPTWRIVARQIGPLLGLSLASQFGLALFEAIFALYAKARFNYGPGEVGLAFVVCGLVMTLFQIAGVAVLKGRIGPLYRIATGLGVMGASLALLVLARNTPVILTVIAFLALGAAVVSPNVSAMISEKGGTGHAGSALGVLNGANSLGQASGPFLGGALYLWQSHAPFLLTGVLLVVVSLSTAWATRRQQAWTALAVA